MIEIFNRIFDKYKEIILYLFFGGLTTIVSIGSYVVFTQVLEINVLIGNVMSWVAAVLFAFATNRKWVFESNTDGKAEFLKQMGSFFGGRLFTLAVEELFLFVFITCLHFSSIWVKIAAQVFVVASNYIISKMIVFRKA